MYIWIVVIAICRTMVTLHRRYAFCETDTKDAAISKHNRRLVTFLRTAVFIAALCLGAQALTYSSADDRIPVTFNNEEPSDLVSPDGHYVAHCTIEGASPTYAMEIDRLLEAPSACRRRQGEKRALLTPERIITLSTCVAGLVWLPHHKHTHVFGVSGVYDHHPRLAMWRGGKTTVPLARPNGSDWLNGPTEEFNLTAISRNGVSVYYDHMIDDDGTRISYILKLVQGSKPRRVSGALHPKN